MKRLFSNRVGMLVEGLLVGNVQW